MAIPHGANAKQTIGTFTRPWNQFELGEAFAAIHEAGFREIGLMRHKGPDGKMASIVRGDLSDAEVKHLQELLQRNELTPIVNWGFVDLWNDDGVEKFKLEIDVASRMGTPTILTGGTNAELGPTYLSIMKSVVDYAAEKDVTIAAKPHGGITATAADCLNVVQEVDHERFRLFFDPANITYYTGGDPLEGLEELAPYVCGLCLKDCRGGEKGEINIPPGEGDVDWKRLFGVLGKHDFDGPCLIECLGGETLADINQRAKQTRLRFKEV